MDTLHKHALAFAALAASFVANPAHAYDVTGTTLDASTVRYTVGCTSGDAAFDAFELQIHPGDSPGSFTLVSGPAGWSIDPTPVVRTGRTYLRVAGPPHACVFSSSVQLTLNYAGSQTLNSRSAGAIVSGSTVLFEDPDCLPGWYAVKTCTPPAPIVTAPEYILVVGSVNSGSTPDPAGAAVIGVRDAANAPLPGVAVALDFSACCDIDLCGAAVSGQTVSCANGTVSGVTDANGEFHFTVMGAARDPWLEDPCPTPGCIYPGCGSQGVVVRVDVGTGPVASAQITAVCVDQNGAYVGGSNGTSIVDVGLMLHLFGGIGLGGVYRGRGDLDMNGQITIADVSAEYAHFGRLGLLSAVGCPGSYCGKPACP